MNATEQESATQYYFSFGVSVLLCSHAFYIEKQKKNPSYVFCVSVLETFETLKLLFSSSTKKKNILSKSDKGPLLSICS